MKIKVIKFDLDQIILMQFPKDKARWIILSFSIFLLFGSYYCFELPAALKDSLEVKYSDHFSKEAYEFFFNSLFSVYSLPNIILPFLNGYLIDKIGLIRVLFVLVSLVTLGQVFFAFAMTNYHYSLMMLARFIFGIGSESLFVAENILLTKYFQGKELSFAIGINLAVANLGGVLNMYFTPRFASSYGTDTAVWIGAILCIFSFFCFIIVVFIDSRLNVASPSLINKETFEYHSRDLKIRDFQAFEKTFWYLAFTGFFLYSCLISWINIGPSYLIEKWFHDLSLEEGQIKAGNCLSLMRLSAVVSGPPIGYFVDNYGFRLKILMLGTLISTISMISLFFTYPILPSILMGLSYSFGVASIYPTIPHVVPKEYLGKANGIVTSLQNLGFFIYPYVIAGFKVGFGDYSYSQVFLVGSTLFAVIFAFLANKAQKGNTKISISKKVSSKIENEMLELQVFKSDQYC